MDVIITNPPFGGEEEKGIQGNFPDDRQTAHFPTWILDTTKIYPAFLTWCFRSPWFWSECESRSRGSTGRNGIRKGLFRQIRIPLPSLEEQIEIHRNLDQQSTYVSALAESYSDLSTMADALMPSVLEQTLRPLPSSEG